MAQSPAFVRRLSLAFGVLTVCQPIRSGSHVAIRHPPAGQRLYANDLC